LRSIGRSRVLGVLGLDELHPTESNVMVTRKAKKM